MPRRHDTREAGEPTVDPGTGLRLLGSLIEKARQLLSSRPITSDAHTQWELLARNYLEKAFGVGSPNVSSITDAGRLGVYNLNSPPEWWEQHRARTLETQITRLEGLVELLETEQQLLRGEPVLVPEPTVEPHRHNIFVVHGHDEAALDSVVRFLEKMDQKVIVLREQPSQGRTIIEKFEAYSHVGFAVVLLTPDDVGSVASAPTELNPRARQNVILELGFFLGRLGRARVCVLYGDGVEVPSDYSGVVFVKLDVDGGWRLSLAKELRAAGFTIDMNKAL